MAVKSVRTEHTSKLLAGTSELFLREEGVTERDRVLVVVVNAPTPANATLVATITQRWQRGGFEVFELVGGPGMAWRLRVSGAVEVRIAAVGGQVDATAKLEELGSIEPAPPYDSPQVLDGGAGGGAWTDCGPYFGYPPPERHLWHMYAAETINVRLVSPDGTQVYGNFNIGPGLMTCAIPHPPRARLQARNPGGEGTTLVLTTTWVSRG